MGGPLGHRRRARIDPGNRQRAPPPQPSRGARAGGGSIDGELLGDRRQGRPGEARSGRRSHPGLRRARRGRGSDVSPAPGAGARRSHGLAQPASARAGILATRWRSSTAARAGLRQWFWTQAQWSTAAGRTAATAWHACVGQTLLGYFLAMSWIALAAVQLRQLETAGRERLMIHAIGGASVILLAVVHRLITARRAILAFDDDIDAEPQVNGTSERRPGRGSGGPRDRADG